jgi:hypothetical protein
LLNGNWFLDRLEIGDELGSSNNTVYSVYDNELKRELALKEIIVN